MPGDVLVRRNARITCWTICSALLARLLVLIPALLPLRRVALKRPDIPPAVVRDGVHTPPVLQSYNPLVSAPHAIAPCRPKPFSDCFAMTCCFIGTLMA